MDMNIFLKKDVVDFVKQAINYGLPSVGEIRCEDKEKIIKCREIKYTFGWITLQKAF